MPALRQLNELALRKEFLLARVAHERADCVELARRLRPPIETIDRVRAYCLQLPPIVKFGAVAAGVWFTRKLARSPRLPFAVLSLWRFARSFRAASRD